MNPRVGEASVHRGRDWELPLGQAPEHATRSERGGGNGRHIGWGAAVSRIEGACCLNDPHPQNARDVEFVELNNP